MNMIAAAVLVASVFALQTPALAENGRAQLRLTVVDETYAAVPNATVTVFTIHGPRTVITDETGIVVLADLPAEMTQWSGRRPGHLSYAEAGKLTPGQNNATVTLRSEQHVESGS